MEFYVTQDESIQDVEAVILFNSTHHEQEKCCKRGWKLNYSYAPKHSECFKEGLLVDQHSTQNWAYSSHLDIISYRIKIVGEKIDASTRVHVSVGKSAANTSHIIKNDISYDGSFLMTFFVY